MAPRHPRARSQCLGRHDGGSGSVARVSLSLSLSLLPSELREPRTLNGLTSRGDQVQSAAACEIVTGSRILRETQKEDKPNDKARCCSHLLRTYYFM